MCVCVCVCVCGVCVCVCVCVVVLKECVVVVLKECVVVLKECSFNYLYNQVGRFAHDQLCKGQIRPRLFCVPSVLLTTRPAYVFKLMLLFFVSLRQASQAPTTRSALTH